MHYFSALVQNVGLQVVDVIKIDVEGGGYEVIMGGMSIIKRHKPVIFFEVHNAKERKALEMLNNLGYNIMEKPGDMYIAFSNIMTQK